MSLESFNSSSRIGSVGRNGVVVGTKCRSVSNSQEGWYASRTFVRSRRDVDHEAELAGEIGRVEVSESEEDLVLVDTLYRAFETILAGDEFGDDAGGVCTQD